MGKPRFIGGNAIPKKAFHHHFAFFVEFHTFFFEHLLLISGPLNAKPVAIRPSLNTTRWQGIDSGSVPGRVST